MYVYIYICVYTDVSACVCGELGSGEGVEAALWSRRRAYDSALHTPSNSAERV